MPEKKITEDDWITNKIMEIDKEIEKREKKKKKSCNDCGKTDSLNLNNLGMHYEESNYSLAEWEDAQVVLTCKTCTRVLKTVSIDDK